MDRRIILAIVAVVVTGGAVFVIQSQSSHHSARHLTYQLQVQGGNTMSPSTISAIQGDTVTLEVNADSAFELHLHGYNRKLELKPGKTTVLTFKASTAGSFEMENEGKSHHLGTLTVNPS